MTDRTANERKRRQREKARTEGGKVIEVRLAASEVEMLKNGCKVRGGLSGPYGPDEYIATLIRRDHEQLQRDMSRLGKCEFCEKDLPQGCGGTFKGQSDCFHTTKAKSLFL